MYGCSTDRAKLNSLCFICSLGQVKKKLWTSILVLLITAVLTV